MISKSAIFLMLLSASTYASAAVKCADVKYGSETYHENMEQLAKEARLEDGYYSRYHEDAVGYICAGKTKDLKSLIDQGDVTAAEVEAIMQVLGKKLPIGNVKRSATGQRYGDSKQRFSEMGLCSACADNVAQYYTWKPTSECGKLAKRALAGDPRALKELRGFPSYCVWQ